MIGSGGLTDVTDADLKTLLASIHRGELECPITSLGLARIGLQRIAHDISLLQGFDSRASQAIIVAALQNRTVR